MKISKKTIAELSNEYSHIKNAHEFLDSLGYIILDELTDLRLIGEIERPEGKDTYIALKNALKKYWEIKKINKFDPGIFNSPERRAVLSLYFVWAGVFNYGADSGNDFWPHVFRELGFDHSPTNSSECGKIFLECLKENNLELFPEISGGLTYVTRILLHGLIPEKHIGKFIENFLLGEFSDVRAKYRTGQSLIHKWSKDWRIEKQPIPVQNFIRHGRPINGDVVDRFWDMSENWKNEGTEFWWRWRLPKYMVDAFKSCIDSTGATKKIIRKKAFAGRPFLTFEFERNDFPTLCIPSQLVSSNADLKIKSVTLKREYKETTESIDAVRIGSEMFLRGREISIVPSKEWTVVLPDKSQTIIYQFPEEASGEIPVFFFNNASGKSIDFAPGKSFPKEIIAVFPKAASFEIEGAEKVTSEISLSHSWQDWNCATFRLGYNSELVYQGPNIEFSKKIEVRIKVLGSQTNQAIPFLDCGRETPSWVRTDGNLDVITDVETLVVRFSDEARRAWRRGVGKLIRLDVSDLSVQNAYFDLDLSEDEQGFVSQPDMLKHIKPGVYEIRIRGSLGMEDIILPFVYIPVFKFDRRGREGECEIHDQFVLDITVSMALEAFPNNVVQYSGNNKVVIKLEHDCGDAFCALKLFGGSKFPVTLLLARGPIRWVRRSEEGLFHWYDWRSVAEEIPIDRLKELRDTRVLVEIDESHSKSLAKINHKNNQLRLLLRSIKGESMKIGDVFMSLNAQNYRRGMRDIWVLDLQKFADQMASMKKAGNAELVLDAPGLLTDTVLFRLLRYSEFENFQVISKRLNDKKEVLEVNWVPHPNEARENRVVTLVSNGDASTRMSIDIPDNEKPPIEFKLKALKKPGIWTAKIEIRRSRFSGKFSEQTSNASHELLRIPEGWVDWPEIPDAPPDELKSGISSFIRFFDEKEAWRYMPWSSFLTFFHQGCGKSHFDEFNRLLGLGLFKKLFPFSEGNILRVRSGNKTVARLQILSHIEIGEKSGNYCDSVSPAKWYRIYDAFSFRFSPIPKSNADLCLFIQPGPDTEPIVKTCGKEYPFSQWLADEKGCGGCGIIMPELPLKLVWANPLYPKMMDGLDCEDLFTYENLCLEDNRDDAKPIDRSLNYHRNGQTTMAAAFTECLRNAKNHSSLTQSILPRIEKKTRHVFDSLADRWIEYSRSGSVHPIVGKMIQMRFRFDPLQALSGAAALVNRIKANGYGYKKQSERADFDELLGETTNFISANLPKMFLRDLMLSEILISWYWEKTYFEFDGVSALKPVCVPRVKKNIQPANRVVSSDKEKSKRSFLSSFPRSLTNQDLYRIWRQKGFFRYDSNSINFERNELDFGDKGDGTILDFRTGLMWEKHGSEKCLSWYGKEPQNYIVKINRSEFAGYKNWRIPTIEELGSLLMPSEFYNPENYTAHYISTKFCKKQITCWSSSTFGGNSFWYINFFSGQPDKSNSVKNFVRAVRTYEKK